MAISWGLVGLGAVALVKALASGSAPIERVSLRAVGGIVAALAVFAATISTLGLVVAALATVFAACMVEPKLRWREVLLLSAGVSLVSIVLFVWVLRIPFQVWPA
jgi:putative tricarboxylic transport membrane protein